jgi:hypothetical protein
MNVPMVYIIFWITFRYADLKNVSPQFNFLDTKTEHYKVMALKIW